MNKFHSHGALLKHLGFSRTEIRKEPNPKLPKRTTIVRSHWEHPGHTTLKIEIDHLTHQFLLLNDSEPEWKQIGKDNEHLQIFLQARLAAKESDESGDLNKTVEEILPDLNVAA